MKKAVWWFLALLGLVCAVPPAHAQQFLAPMSADSLAAMRDNMIPLIAAAPFSEAARIYREIEQAEREVEQLAVELRQCRDEGLCQEIDQGEVDQLLEIMEVIFVPIREAACRRLGDRCPTRGSQRDPAGEKRADARAFSA